MKKILLSLLFYTSFLFAEEIVIYGPSSSKWMEKYYGPIFKEKTGVDIKYISIDGIISRLKLEKNNPKADIVVGLTSLQGEIAKKENHLVKYEPKNKDDIKNDFYIIDKDYYVTSFDYGYLAINYNKEKISTPPKNIEELGKISKELIAINPMTSSTGEEALLWSIALCGDKWEEFWEKIKPSIYVSEPGWSEAFSKFSTREAPMMIGYATSNIFFSQDKDQQKFDSFYLEEGAYMYLEGAALVNKKEIKEGAKLFMEEILSDDFQKLVVSKNYMFPVTGIDLGEDFKSVPLPSKAVKIDDKHSEDLIENLDKYKNRLAEILKE